MNESRGMMGIKISDVLGCRMMKFGWGYRDPIEAPGVYLVAYCYVGGGNTCSASQLSVGGTILPAVLGHVMDYI